MKFISKNSNYRAVLRPGIPAEPVTGRAAVSGLYVKFQDGQFETLDEETIDLLKKHPGFDSDYILVEEGSTDPFDRESIEPEHDLVEIKHGSVVGNQNPKPKLVLNKEQKKMLEKIAAGMALEMVKEMVSKKGTEENATAPEVPEAIIAPETGEEEMELNIDPEAVTQGTIEEPSSEIIKPKIGREIAKESETKQD
ncbi:hypothetical protein KAR91_81115 [Candidatus Pacearchaeota archaeon]|nr:hypothetical protein [Candidatus Pacearchaeota archaeon]